MIVHIVDVDSGNLQSIENAIEHLGHTVVYITNGQEMRELTSTANHSTRLILPGVGNFGHFVHQLNTRGLKEPVKEYVNKGFAMMGVCVGLQALFEKSSEDNFTSSGLGLVKQQLSKFSAADKSVPHIGWSSVDSLTWSAGSATAAAGSGLFGIDPSFRYYSVHSYAAMLDDAQIETLRNEGFDLAIGSYGKERFISAVSINNVFATQFHPEKSGNAGIQVIKNFLDGNKYVPLSQSSGASGAPLKTLNGMSYRIIACLDVRSNDNGDLVVTKGDQYDVKDDSNKVRNLGKPVKLAENYYQQGADEVTFLNITSFKNCPLQDLPMLEVLKQSSKTIFVPLTVGGGIKNFKQPDGTVVSALKVAETYFRSGADKVSIGSDAVRIAEEYYANGEKSDGKTAIEMISGSYGNQAVVISVDPKRKYVSDADVATVSKKFKIFKTKIPGPNGETHVYYEVSIKGGREFSSKIGAYELVTCCEKLGAGEILLNCIDKDGSNSGFDLELVKFIKDSVSIPVIASSGAGKPDHFLEVFKETNVDAALGAGMFHRGEYKIKDVKDYLQKHGYAARYDS